MNRRGEQLSGKKLPQIIQNSENALHNTEYHNLFVLKYYLMDKLWDKNKCDFRRKTYSGISQIWIQAKEGRRPTKSEGEILINDQSVSLRRVHAYKYNKKKIRST